jgi:hydrazine synthase alpha subunit-like protein
MLLAAVTKLSRWTLLVALSACFGFILFSLQAPVSHSESRGDLRLPDIIFVQAPTVVAGELSKRFPRGSRLVRLNPSVPQKEINLTPDFFAAADPRVSADVSKVLFSAQKAADAPWQVWEMNADGSDQRQITHCDADCLTPAYLADGEIVYSKISTKTSREQSSLFVSRADGSRARQITFGAGNFQVETVLRDGRILVSADSLRAANDQGRSPRLLYTLRTDGTGLSLFRSDSEANLLGTGAEELESGAVLFVSGDGPGRQTSAGELAWIPPGVSHNSRITPRQYAYWSAHQLDGDSLVVSRKSSTAPSKVGRYDLYAFNLTTRAVGKLIYRNPQFSSVQAVALEPRPEPKRYMSILHPQQRTGRVLCLNSYLSADVTGGRVKGRIARVRVLMLDAEGNREVNLGEAPVESDGSFYVSVPADRPIRFETLNEQGGLIRAQKSWVWTRPGEDMGCAGCHDDKAQAPDNHWPLVLNRFDTPIVLGESDRAKTASR